jgi:S-formylglutathione hydrolase FrmB
MSLTGPYFLALTVSAVIGLFLVLICSWTRWSGRTVRAILGRAGMLAGVNVMVLLAAAVTLNDQFVFFADWTDLSGAVGIADTPADGINHSGGDAHKAIDQPSNGGGTRPNPPQVNPAQIPRGARRVRFTVAGPVSGITARVDVYLPVGYTDPAQRTRRYPVLQTFPGYPGSPFVPVAAIDAAVAAHLMTAPIVIASVAEIPAGRDTECVDGTPRDPKVETWLTRDVPDWAQRTLRVNTDRGSWATLGVSAGGWCAAMATMLHPDRYAAAVVLGGYFRPDFGTLYAPFTPNSPQGRRYDLVALAAQHPPAVALWVQTSQADRLSYPTSSQLLAGARAPLSVQSLVMAHAGHRVDVWLPLIPQTLAWLATTLPGFNPHPTQSAPTTPSPTLTATMQVAALRRAVTRVR